MIVRPRPHWLHLLFVRRGSLVRRIFWQQLCMVGFAVLIVLIHAQIAWNIPLTAGPFSLMGVALAIFLGFRLNTSYDRYWEARKHWGLILIECRNLSRRLLAHLGKTPDTRAAILALGAFAALLRNQLRQQAPLTGTEELLPTELRQQLGQRHSPPTALLLHLGQQLHRWRQSGQLDTVTTASLEHSLDTLSHAQGSCERIASTPLPFTYGVILHRTTYVYCLLLPFGLVDAIGWVTPLIVAFIAYTFFALEDLSAEIEEPFGLSMNDLALDAIVRTIEINLRQQLDEPAPPPLTPNADYLLT